MKLSEYDIKSVTVVSDDGDCVLVRLRCSSMEQMPDVYCRVMSEVYSGTLTLEMDDSVWRPRLTVGT